MTDLESRLDGVLGGRTAKSLRTAFEMETVEDLLRHYPRRLAERGELTDLSALRIDDEVTVLAEVSSATVHRYRTPGHAGRRGPTARLEVVVGKGSESLHLVFFGPKSNYHERVLQPGVRGLFSGKVGEFRQKRQLVHPDYQLLDHPADELEDDWAVDAYAGALIPVYRATKDVRTWTIARSVAQVLALLDPLPDPVPETVLAEAGLMGFDQALRTVHQPDSWPAYRAALRRLTWDEALLVQVALARRRAAADAHPTRPRPLRVGGLLDAFDAQLPFELTRGQRQVGGELAEELSRPRPMARLLQGDVGSGKTIVALRAMLQVVDAGGQAALLAPTEVLAAQHARTIETMLGPLARGGQLGGADIATRVALLTGSLPTAARRAALLEAASGQAGIVVGTHALIQDQVSFAELGLVVVDEQHRFGVEQRDALRGKAEQPPHLLVMTATPIPRTVAMTVFGDLDTSVLAELPAGRSPIATSVVPTREKPAWLERAWSRIREEVAAGRQAYVVCPRIGDGAVAGDDLDLLEPTIEDREPGEGPGRAPLALVDVFAQLAAGPLAGLRLAALHGRLTPEEKDRAMTEFSQGRIDVLVATTVVEVGVDVPNATVMTILDAERFGVSQLHQLRGRVGRGGHPGLCLLVTDARADSPSRERLDAVAATTDGFELARLDVEQRREGDVLGAAQSGRRSPLRLLSVLHHEELIGPAREVARALVAQDPALGSLPALARAVERLVGADRAEFLDKA